MRALHKKKSVKAIVISGVSLLLAAAIVVGVLWYLGHRSDPVKVAPVSMFMGWLSNESTQSGNVTADNLQKIYASDTQTVTALLVQEGQTVKKGDPLFRYDTTLSDIQVERQEIAVKQDDLNLNKAKKDLANINRLRPYVPTQPTDPPTEPTEPEPTDEPTQPPEPTEPTVPIAPEELPYLMGGEGTQASPLFYLCAADMQYDQAYFEELLGEKTELWVVFQVREGNAVCKLAERVARAGRDDQQIEQALRAKRLDLRQRVQRFRAAQRRDLRPEIRRCAEAGVRLPRGVRKNGDDRILRCQGAQGVNGLSECAERAAQGKADSRSHAGNAPSCSRIAAA